jgi:hypothetical protein
MVGTGPYPEITDAGCVFIPDVTRLATATTLDCTAATVPKFTSVVESMRFPDAD